MWQRKRQTLLQDIPSGMITLVDLKGDILRQDRIARRRRMPSQSDHRPDSVGLVDRLSGR